VATSHSKLNLRGSIFDRRELEKDSRSLMAIKSKGAHRQSRLFRSLLRTKIYKAFILEENQPEPNISQINQLLLSQIKHKNLNIAYISQAHRIITHNLERKSPSLRESATIINIGLACEGVGKTLGPATKIFLVPTIF